MSCLSLDGRGACYVLALYEELARAGLEIRSPLFGLRAGAALDDLLGLSAAEVVEDLRRLSWTFYDGQAALLGHPAVPSPSFEGSGDLGGADADLIVGGCLVEIKATVNPVPLKPLDLQQVVCHALLDYDDEYAIDSAGIYLARQGFLVRWPLPELVSVLTEGPWSVDALRHDPRKALAAA